MAEGSDDKTEAPTGKRIGQARERGQVPRSREAATFAVLMAGVVALWLVAPLLGNAMNRIMHLSFSLTRDQIFSVEEMGRVFVRALITAAVPVLLFAFIVLCCALYGNFYVGGYNLSTQAIMPKFSKMNPLSGLRRIVSLNALVELLKAFAKVLFIGAFCYFALRYRIHDVLRLSYLDSTQALQQAIMLLFRMMLVVVLALIPIVLIDVPFQKWHYLKQLRMSKQEVKDEFKDAEGNPQIKSKLRHLQYQMAARRMMKKVPEADVVVTNPTQYAVALQYEPDGPNAPVVVAKGVDEIAEKIKEIARAYAVPVIPAPPLARSLYYTTDLDQQIPRGLFKAVAQVLAWVLGMKSYKEGKVSQRPRDLDRNLPIPDELRF